MSTTQEFLFALGHEGEITTQTFTDNKERFVYPKIRHGSFEVLEPKLHRDNAKGAGVFFCVNRTDLRGRRLDNMIELLCFFADLDNAPLLDEYPLEPTGIIESSKDRHQLYWRTEGIPLDQFAYAEYQRQIATLIGSDPVVNDMSRVMRLPNFYHNKAEPFQSKIIHLNPDARYSFDEFKRAFFLVPHRTLPPLPKAAQSYLAEGQGDNRGLLYERVATAPQGQRNHALFKVAAALKNDVKSGKFDESMIREELQAAAQMNGLDIQEVLKTINSAFRYEGR